MKKENNIVTVKHSHSLLEIYRISKIEYIWQRVPKEILWRSTSWKTLGTMKRISLSARDLLKHFCEDRINSNSKLEYQLNTRMSEKLPADI